MQVTRFKRQHLPITIIVIVGVCVWVLSTVPVAAAGYADSAHGDDTNGVERSGCQDSQEPPQACPIGSCAHCHDTFDSDICAGTSGGPHQLFAPLDDPDFCMECHTDTDPVQVLPDAAANIADVFTKTYKHNVLGYSGLHRFWHASPPAEDSGSVEDRTYLSANKHVECNDCHNPHRAAAGLHLEGNERPNVPGEFNVGFGAAAGTNATAEMDADKGSGPLTGASGVDPTIWRNNWSGPLTDDWEGTSSTATKEYQVCFKCHSNYNTSFASWGGSGTESWTNVALEFNPNNGSYHPVVQTLPETDPGANGSNRLPAAFTSLLIGDSGHSRYGRDFTIQIDPDATNGKRWKGSEWVNWGVRVGTMSMAGDWRFDNVGRVTNNSTTALGVTFQGILGLPSTYDDDVVYSIEYYAGMGSKSGTRITDNYKDFRKYLRTLVGYWVVIQSAPGASQQMAIGKVNNMDPSTPSTWFEVEQWFDWQRPGGGVPVGGVPPDGTGEKTVGYYFSATGQSMMCSDCHSNDEISQTAAQGPHGSSVKWMLKGRNKAWPTLADSENGQGTGTLRTIGPRANSAHRSVMDGNPNGDGLFCLNCHSTVSFSKDKYGVQNQANVHVLHASGWSQPPACVRCHILVPHGGKLSRLIGDQDGSMPVRYAFGSDSSNMWIIGYSKASGPEDYAPSGDDWCTENCHGVGMRHLSGYGEDW